MPKVKTKSGKVKHFAYTQKGMDAAVEAANKGGKIVGKKKKKRKIYNSYGA